MMDTQTSATLSIIVNGQPMTLAARTLGDLVEQQCLTRVKVATAVNGRFVAVALRAETLLADGDRVEIVSPRQGG